MKSISISYIFFFAFLGIYSSLLSLHFSNLNFSGSQIATFFSIIPAISFFFNIFWGRIADNYYFLKKLNIILPLAGSIGYAITIYINTYPAYICLAVITGIIVNPIFALSDSLSITYCKKTKSSYGNLRQWGTASFSLINFLIFLILKYATNSNNTNSFTYIHEILYLMPIFLFCRFLSSFQLPSQQEKENKLTINQFFKLMGNKPLLLFFIACMFHSMASVSNYVYFSPHLKSIGFNSDFIALCWGISPLFEILVFRYSHLILNRVSLFTLFRISVLIAALRWLIVATSRDQNIILWSQTLHTFGFGTYFLATIHILMNNIPEKVRSSGQGFFNAFAGMLGLIMGNLILGQITERLPIFYVYYASLVFSFTAYLISYLIPQSFWSGNTNE